MRWMQRSIIFHKDAFLKGDPCFLNQDSRYSFRMPIWASEVILISSGTFPRPTMISAIIPTQFIILFPILVDVSSVNDNIALEPILGSNINWPVTENLQCNDTPLAPTYVTSSLLTMSLLGRWSTSGSEGGNAHFLPLQEYDRGNGRKRDQTNKHEQNAWG